MSTPLQTAVATLDTNATGHAGYQDQDNGITVMRRAVARALARRFRDSVYGGAIKARKHVTKHDVSVALGALGMSPFAIGQHAHAIAAMIRADFTDGRED